MKIMGRTENLEIAEMRKDNKLHMNRAMVSVWRIGSQRRTECMSFIICSYDGFFIKIDNLCFLKRIVLMEELLLIERYFPDLLALLPCLPGEEE